MTALHDELVTDYGPHAGILDAEAAVAGACMVSTRLADAAAEILDEADFHDFGHAAVFAAACELSGAGHPIDPTSVKNQLIATDRMRNLGANMGRLLNLMHGAPLDVETVRYHADLVKADAIRRRVQLACVRGVGISGHVSFELEHVDRILEDIHGALPGVGGEQRPMWLGDDIDNLVESLTQPLDDVAIPSPWPDLDEVVTMHGGQLIVVGARPGGGKSLFGTQVAGEAAIKHDIPALIASMEMLRPEVEQRILSERARVDSKKLERRCLSDNELARIRKVAAEIRNAPLVIDDQTNTTLGHIRARLRWMQRTRPARLLVVDYLQLMTPTRKAERRDLEIAEMTRGLKLMAGELNLCVIALAQLNRGPEQRTNKRPQMSDLRESGSLENDANVVLFTHPEPETSGGDRRLGELDIIVAKNRTGQSQIDVPLAYQPHYSRFVPMAKWAD